MAESIHYSEIDPWFVVIIASVVVGSIISLLLVFRKAGSNTRSTNGNNVFAIVALSLLPTLVIPVWILFSTKYTITDSSLTVVSGPFRWVIKIDSIESISETRSMRSAPALSLDRLLLRYNQGEVIIVSPNDKQKFANDLGFETQFSNRI